MLPEKGLLETENSFQKELESIKDLVMIVDPRKPNYQGVALGIEITTPDYHGLNLDHHGPGYTSESPAAIEQALTFNLDTLPEGKIATLRPDVDSAGAIAVLLLRKEGVEPDHQIVKAIGLFDRKGIGIFKNKGKELLGVDDSTFENLLHYVFAARYKIVSQRTPLPEAVLFMKRLLSGKIEKAEIDDLYQQDQKELEEALKTSQVYPFAGGQAVVVIGSHPRGFDIGYEIAPIVVAYNPEFKWPSGKITPKISIARYDSNVGLDIKGLRQALQKLDPEWGGPENLIASPQGKDPGISLEKIQQLVEQFIR